VRAISKTVQPLRIAASATPGVCRQLSGPGGPALLLGAFPTAVYLQLPAGSVIAVLARDAVALPIGLVLNRHSRELALLQRGSDGWLAGGVLRLADLELRVGSLRSAALPRLPAPLPEQLSTAHQALAEHFPDELELAGPDLLSPLTEGNHERAGSAVATLLGRGPGLTPAGDDLLCGMLAGAHAFGHPLGAMPQALTEQLASRPRATTSLSRQLLLSALDGEGIDQLGDLATALCLPDPVAVRAAVAALARVGHSSGLALGRGLLLVAEQVASSPVGGRR
jgi:Protein of unknown function (DUF2877)